MDASDLLVGTYEGGIYRLTRKPDAAGWVVAERYEQLRNASYMAYNPRCGVHYAVEEEAGEIVAFRISPSGVEEVGRVRSGGAAPCFVAVNAACTALAAANYKSGSVSLFRLDADTGRILASPALFENAGNSADAERQDRPHAHCVGFHGPHLYSTDLGTDEVLRFAIGDAGDIAGAPETVFRLPPGQGPRHLLFHPHLPIAYLLTELGSSVFVLEVGEGGLVERQCVSTLPAGFDGDSLGGHLALDAAGDRLLVSNRGHDSIALFAVGSGGEIALRDISPTHRASPRHFCLLESEQQIIVAHEKDDVVVLAMTPDGTVGAAVEMHEIPKAAYVGVATPQDNHAHEDARGDDISSSKGG